MKQTTLCAAIILPESQDRSLPATVLHSLHFHAASPWMLIQMHTDGFFGCRFWGTRVPVTYIDIFTPKPFSSGKRTIKKRQNVCLYCNRRSLIPHIIIRRLRCHFDTEKIIFFETYTESRCQRIILSLTLRFPHCHNHDDLLNLWLQFNDIAVKWWVISLAPTTTV